MTDARAGLTVLNETWANCVGCRLGQRRTAVKGSFVKGEGSLRGVMFVGEGPGIAEEEEGRPFCGKAGVLLRGALQEMAFPPHYITNVVACRSCSPAYTNEGRPIIRNGRAVLRDEPPSPDCVTACLPRLHAEIYLVDPLLIVAFGAEAGKALQHGRAVEIRKQNGRPREITVPGNASAAVMTAKKGQWFRKVKGEYVAPVTLREVRYLLIPIVHPTYVLRFGEDRRDNEALDLFTKGLLYVKTTYKRLQEMYAK